MTGVIRDHPHIQPPLMDWLILLYWESVITAPRPTKKLVFVPLGRHTDCIIMASGWRVLVSRAKWVVRQEERETDGGGEASCLVAGSRCTTQAVRAPHLRGFPCGLWNEPGASVRCSQRPCYPSAHRESFAFLRKGYMPRAQKRRPATDQALPARGLSARHGCVPVHPTWGRVPDRPDALLRLREPRSRRRHRMPKCLRSSQQGLLLPQVVRCRSEPVIPGIGGCLTDLRWGSSGRGNWTLCAALQNKTRTE